MAFNPTLNAGFAFNQPVQAPNAMEAVAGLFNFGVDVATKNASNQPKPTEDEKFAMAVKEFESDKGATFNWDRKGMREFIFKYPQFTSQAKTYAENLGVMTQAPEEVARDAGLEWFKTSEGMLAVAQSSNMPENEREAFLSEQLTKAKQQEAKLAELERNNATYAAEGTLVTRQWDVLKPTSKDMVDNTVSAILAPLVNDVTNGLTVDVPEDLRQMLGIRYDKIDMNNLNAVLADTKMFLGKQVRGSFNSNFGVDALPADDWNKEVFASLDSLIEIGKSVQDPVGRANVTKALIETEMYRKLDENGVAVVTMLAEKVPAETLNRMIGTMAEFDEGFIAALSGGGQVFNTAGITSAVQDMSKSEAENLANDTIKIFEHGVVPEFFTAFKEAQKRSGYNVVDGESYKKIVSGNITEINKLVSENPDFRGEFGGWVTSDIQQTISTIRSNLIAGVNLEFDGKQFVMVPEAGTLAAQKWDDPYRPYKQSAENQLPDDMNLRVLNEKIATLGLMGEFGKEIQEAVGILNTEPKGKTSSRGIPKGRGRGRVTPADVVGGLQTRGMPPHIAEGFAMNVGDESGFRTDINEASPIVEGSRGGFGLIQWTGPRRRALEAFAAAQGKPVDDLDMQLDFLMQELGGPESAAWKKISATTTREEAAVAILTEFLRPAEEHQKSRAARYTSGKGPAGMPVDSLPAEDQGASPTLSLDSSAREVPTSAQGPSTVSTEALQGTLLSFESPEVQQIVEKARSAPEEAIAMAKEILTKPMDPAIKALIEALVRIGEKA